LIIYSLGDSTCGFVGLTIVGCGGTETELVGSGFVGGVFGTNGIVGICG